MSVSGSTTAKPPPSVAASRFLSVRQVTVPGCSHVGGQEHC